MNGSVEGVRIDRCLSFGNEARDLLEEYYDSLGVVLRDDAETMARILGDARSGMWVVFCQGETAGCIVLKAGVPHERAGEVKRLYVRPAYRRKGLADALMGALEAFAAGAGIAWLYLDTSDAFSASVALYERRGYVECARYNDNPQATMFFRKQLG